MILSLSQHLLPALLLSLLAVPSPASGVRIVEPTGTQSFATLQAAVDAAPEGALLLVGSGVYAGFLVDGKSVHILAAGEGTVTIQGIVRVLSTGRDQDVVLSGLRVENTSGSNAAALRIDQCAGSVFVQDCAFHPSDQGVQPCAFSGPEDGGPGAYVVSSPRVTFARCTLAGGRGAALAPNEPADCAPAGDGGDGLLGYEAALALYDCTFRGGGGGASHGFSGDGGAGLRLIECEAFLSNCSRIGGLGGANTAPAPGRCGGQGGPALATDVQVYGAGGLTDPGDGGQGAVRVGSSGPGVSGGGSLSSFSQVKIASIAELATPDLASWSVELDSPFSQADKVFLLAALEPAAVFAVTFNPVGMAVIDRSALLPSIFLGVSDAFGQLAAVAAVPDLPAGSLYQLRYAQVVARQSNQVVHYASPGALLLLDRDSGPDCDGNGSSDFVDVIENPASDANQDLIPDACAGG